MKIHIFTNGAEPKKAKLINVGVSRQSF